MGAPRPSRGDSVAPHAEAVSVGLSSSRELGDQSIVLGALAIKRKLRIVSYDGHPLSK
jgi:hypothetical protein